MDLFLTIITLGIINVVFRPKKGLYGKITKFNNWRKMKKEKGSK